MTRPLTLATALLLAACGPGSNPGTGGGGDGGGENGGGGMPSGGGAPTTGAPMSGAQVRFQMEHGAADPGVAALDLRVVAFGVFFERTGAPPRADDRCELGDDVLDVDDAVELDLTHAGRTPLATVEIGDDRPVGEIRVFLSDAEIEHDGHKHAAHGGATCLAADGTPLIAIVLHPQRAFRFDHGERVDVVIPLDPRADLDEDHVTCPADDHRGGEGGDDGDSGGGDNGGSGGNGGSGDMGGGGNHGGGSGGGGLTAVPGKADRGDGGDDQDAPECREQDDDDDDGNPATRLQFFLPADLRCDVEGG